jgi:hypothetical protein
MSGGGLGAHTIARHGRGGTRAMAWCGQPLAPLRLCFGLRLVSGKIETSAFVSSNSENISCVTFLKQKIAENTELVIHLKHIYNV